MFMKTYFCSKGGGLCCD